MSIMRHGLARSALRDVVSSYVLELIVQSTYESQSHSVEVDSISMSRQRNEMGTE